MGAVLLRIALFSLLSVAFSDDTTVQKSIHALQEKIARLEQRLVDLKTGNDDLQKRIENSRKEFTRCDNFLGERYGDIYDSGSTNLINKLELIEKLGESLKWIMPRYKDLSSKDACTSEPLIDSREAKTLLSASSTWDNWHRPSNSLLNYDGPRARAWCSKKNDKNQWIQADFREEKEVSAIALRRRGDDKWPQYVTKYFVSYSSDGANWVKNETIIEGLPWKQLKPVQQQITIHQFSTPFTARYVRIHPQGWSWHVAVRWEIYGTQCKDESEQKYITSLNGDGIWASGNQQHSNPRFTRLNSPQSWTGMGDGNDYIQINLKTLREIIAIATQGSPTHDHWTMSYELAFSNTTDTFTAYNQGAPLQGNSNKDEVVIQPLQPFVAQYIRLIPKTFNGSPALRWELYGPPAGKPAQSCLW